MSNLIETAQQAYQVHQAGWLDFKAGDTICVYLKVQEKGKERIQRFQGVVIQLRGQTLTDKTFTVRKVSNGIAVERIFPVCLPSIQKTEVVRRGRVRRAKLFYLRGKIGHAAKIKHREGREKKSVRKSKLQSTSTQSAFEVEAAGNSKQNINLSDQ